MKQTALFKTIQTLISQGIVDKSQSPNYSQILMVPKPDGTFRMCVDYRALNDCTADASWPIPNIAEMLTVGSGKSSTDCIFVRDICNPFSDTTLPTNSSSE